MAKGMAPAGPAAFSTSSLLQSAGQFPAINKPATSTGRPNSFMPVSKHIVREGIKRVADKITPSAKRVAGAVAPLRKFSAVFIGASKGKPDRLKIIAKIIVNSTGFLASRLKETCH
jgi:hypothetical protein